MRNGFYVETEASNLREYNRMNKESKYETRFAGWWTSANGYAQRFYQDYIKGTETSVGEPYNIYFNC